MHSGLWNIGARVRGDDHAFGPARLPTHVASNYALGYLMLEVEKAGGARKE